MASPTTISSEKLEKILEVNSKAIEINTIVNGQFEKIIDFLESSKTNDATREKEINQIVDYMKSQHVTIIANTEEFKKTSENLISYIKGVKDVVDRIDRTLFRISVILIGSSAIVTTIVQVLAKFVFKL